MSLGRAWEIEKKQWFEVDVWFDSKILNTLVGVLGPLQKVQLVNCINVDPHLQTRGLPTKYERDGRRSLRPFSRFKTKQQKPFQDPCFGEISFAVFFMDKIEGRPMAETGFASGRCIFHKICSVQKGGERGVFCSRVYCSQEDACFESVEDRSSVWQTKRYFTHASLPFPSVHRFAR